MSSYRHTAGILSIILYAGTQMPASAGTVYEQHFQSNTLAEADWEVIGGSGSGLFYDPEPNQRVWMGHEAGVGLGPPALLFTSNVLVRVGSYTGIVFRWALDRAWLHAGTPWVSPAVRAGAAWYVATSRYATALDGVYAMQEHVYDPTSSAWQSLSVTTDAVARGSAASSNIEGDITAFGLFSEKTADTNGWTADYDDVYIIGLTAPAPFINGADLSYLQQLEDLGAVFRDNGTPRDALLICKDHCVDTVRLRLWHSPTSGLQAGYSDLSHVLGMAQRIRAADMKLLLDFHYSDTWADPGKQTKPAAWATNTFGELLTNVYLYTRDVVSNLAAQGTPPEAVQIGNEITPGFLWEDGHVGGSYDTNWDRFCVLLAACSRGVRDGAGTNGIRVVIHIDAGGNNATCRWFFDNVICRGVPFDVIGLSYYPWWHGPLSALESNLNDLAVRFGRDIAVVETGYPWTLTNYDSMNNFVWEEAQVQPGYPATRGGQRDFLREVKRLLKKTPDHRGIGMYYWAPDYVSVQPIKSCWENVATFDNSTNALPSLEAFADPGCERLAAGPVSGGVISLELSNLAPGSTSTVQRANGLRDALWTNIHVLAGNGGRTNWTDAPATWTSLFYRVITP